MKNHLLIFFEGHCRKKSVEISDKLKFFLKDFDSIDYLSYKDSAYNWYLNDIDDFIKKINNEIKGYPKITFVGRSAGGYIAILIGSLLNIDNVIAFSPQTFVSHLPRRVQKLSKHKNFINLKNIISKKTNFYIHTQKGNDLKHGFQHYENIKHFENVNFIGHKSFDLMCKDGSLKKIVEKL